MTIESFVKSEFERRLERSHCLVIHDPEKRYQAICSSLADATTTVVDASDSIVLGREKALEAWVRLADKPGSHLVVYLPWPKPKDDRARRENPFAPFELGGSVFPDGDADNYRELCLQAFPAREEEVARLFEAGLPSFEAVDGLAGGAIWPSLRALLGVESEREMLLALIAPGAALRKQLGTGGPWLEEARRLVKASLGFILPEGPWPTIQESLGRFLLFSEFVLDLPGVLPPSLSEVPHAGPDRRSLVFALCESLRDSKATQASYRELAERIDETLGLSGKFAKVEALGKRGTFSFQNRVMLKTCIDMANASDFGSAQQICLSEEATVWYESSSSMRSVWACARAAIKVLDGLSLFTCITEERRSVEDYITLYRDCFSNIDASYRDLEMFVADAEIENDSGETITGLIEHARDAYFKTADGFQREFLQVLEREPWIGAASKDQANVFKTRIAPRLDAREKTAYFMIDALRFDLARELVMSLPASYRNSLDTVRGKLPSVTVVGMAALLPGAESNLSVEIDSGTLIPRIGTEKVATAQERVAYIKSIYGDRVRDIPLNALEGLKKTELGDQVDLLVVRSTDIDAAGESLGAEALPMLSLLLRNLLRALERARKLGFPKAIIVTDHGFLLQPPTGAGGAITKPDGLWEAAGARYLLGEGSKTSTSKLYDAGGAGVPAYPKKIAVPAGLGSFVSGTRYVHGGLSLQECLLPVITIDFPSQAPKKREIGVALSYRGGMTKKITTMRPSLDLAVSIPEHTDMFGSENEMDVSIAIMVRGTTSDVGRAQASAGFDPGSGCYRLKPGKAIKITIAMHEDYRGAFTVSALDPVTLEQFAKLELETDYTE